MTALGLKCGSCVQRPTKNEPADKLTHTPQSGLHSLPFIKALLLSKSPHGLRPSTGPCPHAWTLTISLLHLPLTPVHLETFAQIQGTLSQS